MKHLKMVSLVYHNLIVSKNIAEFAFYRRGAYGKSRWESNCGLFGLHDK